MPQQLSAYHLKLKVEYCLVRMTAVCFTSLSRATFSTLTERMIETEFLLTKFIQYQADT